jgi:serine phosphatase RsbU (regulator of sigma subunit)/anti-sigma regulatory factor (Ser/Thr protein kinase)
VRGPDDLVASAAYQPEPAAAAAARRFVRETLRSWQIGERTPDPDRVADDAALLTSELVTNAVVHAGTTFDVTCRLASGELEVAVRDRHPARTLPDIPKATSTSAERGRGLLLPSALASSWGVTYARTAKVVWFRMSLADDEASSPAAGGPFLEAPPAAGPRSVTAAGTGPHGAMPDPVTPDQVMPETVTAGAAAVGTDDGAAAHAGPAGRDRAEAGHAAAHPAGAAAARRAGAAAADAPEIAGLRPDLGTLSYDELLRHTVETARDVVTADAAYALVADEDGELRVRAAAGVGVSEDLFAPSMPAVFADGAAARSLVTVPFLVDGRVTGVLGAAATSPDRFDGDDAAKLQDVADRVAMSLERARLSELERKRRGRIGFLAEASELLASTLDQEKTISLIAQLVVPRLATWCAVLLADDGGALQPSYIWHANESLIDPLGSLLDAAAPPEAPEAGRSWSLAVPATSDLAEEAVALASDAAWCFPLAARGRSLGMVVIGRPRGDRLPREALELAEDLARRAALALDNARLYEQQQLTSQALQRSLLPPELPRIPGVDLAVAHEVAGEGNEVGGDFYDVFPAGENRWRFAIGDVCGTGPEAAAVTGLARHALRILAREGHDVADVVGRLNELILEEGPRARFITLLHGEITVLGDYQPAGTAPDGAPPDGARPSAVRLSLVSAGHPLPLLLRAEDAVARGRGAAATAAAAAGRSGPGTGLGGGHPAGTEPARMGPAGPGLAGPGLAGTGPAATGTGLLPQPAAEPQPLLGVMGDLSFAAQTVEMCPGDLLLCVTDGITERRDSRRLLDDDDGLARMLARCGGLNAGAVAARIQRAAEDFGTGPRADDMALLVLRAL